MGGASFELNLITLTAAWGAAEIIRYGFFAFKVYPDCMHFPLAERGAVQLLFEWKSSTFASPECGEMLIQDCMW